MLQRQLEQLEGRIDKLESSHLARWTAGNFYLSFDAGLAQSRRKFGQEIPSHSKLFSLSSPSSTAALDLDFRNKRIVPLEV